MARDVKDGRSMVQDRLSPRLWMVMALGFLGACGGNVEVSSGGNGGEGGTGAEGGGTTTTTGNTGGGNTGGTGGNTGGGNTGGNTGGTGGNTGGTGGGNTGGTGGNTGGTGGNTGGTGGGTGGGVACEALGHVECVGAFPGCVPVYDDACCSDCYPDPSGCADCTDLYFHHCAPWQELCGGGPTQDCGFAPEWACNGKEPDCESAAGGIEPCSGETGCIPAYCSEAADCPFAYVCHPVKPNMCNAICATVPPPCPPGTVAETDGGCWTGLCIPANLCF